MTELNSRKDKEAERMLGARAPFARASPVHFFPAGLCPGSNKKSRNAKQLWA